MLRNRDSIHQYASFSIEAAAVDLRREDTIVIKPNERWTQEVRAVVIRDCEFAFFRFIMGQSWEAPPDIFNVLRGRLWVLVVETVLQGPIMVGSLL
jgi:hypothetical protein